jgi:GTP-binding protein
LLIFADLFSTENIKPVKQVQLLKNELDSFKDDLTQKVSWIICNKIDLINEEDLSQIKTDLEKELNISSEEVFFISAATGEGTTELLKKLETEVIRNKFSLKL